MLFSRRLLRKMAVEGGRLWDYRSYLSPLTMYASIIVTLSKFTVQMTTRFPEYNPEGTFHSLLPESTTTEESPNTLLCGIQ